MFDGFSASDISLRFLICLLSLSLLSQGCGNQNTVLDGNGHPYEGLTVEGEDSTIGDQDQKSTLDVREGGVVQRKFQTRYLCTNDKSPYLESLRFGIRPSGKKVIIVKTLDSGSFEVDWVETDHNFYFLRDLDENTTLAGLFTEKVFDEDGGRMVARYSSKLGMIFGEEFDCEAPASTVANSGRDEI